jgi:hypothetical protein
MVTSCVGILLNERTMLLGKTMNSDIYIPFTLVNYIKLQKVDCIWFKSLDCGYTWTLLNTHCTSSYNAAQCLSHCC